MEKIIKALGIFLNIPPEERTIEKIKSGYFENPMMNQKINEFFTDLDNQLISEDELRLKLDAIISQIQVNQKAGRSDLRMNTFYKIMANEVYHFSSFSDQGSSTSNNLAASPRVVW